MVFAASLEDRSHMTPNTTPAIKQPTVKAITMMNLWIDFGLLKSSDAKKLAPIDKKKIARFK
jgi:hypothetical protein